MGNLIKFIRLCISKISPESSEADGKNLLLQKMQSFYGLILYVHDEVYKGINFTLFAEDRIVFAAESIASYVISTIRDGDVSYEYFISDCRNSDCSCSTTTTV